MIKLPDSAQLQRLSAFAGDATAAWRLLASLVAELYAPLASALVLRTAGMAPRLVALTSASGEIRIDAVDPFDADGTAPALTDPRTVALLTTTQATRIDLATAAPDGILRQLLGVDVAIAVPMRVAGNSDHLLVLATSADHPLASADLALVELLLHCFGAYLGGALHRRDLVEETRRARIEINGLADLQRLLLPENPQIRGLAYAIHYQPAAIAGGDYYDLMRLSHRIPDFPAGQPDTFGLMLADVSGHGAGAAMEAAQFDAILREHQFHNHTCDVESGDLLVLYTDGITEARDRSGVQFGVGRLEAILAQLELDTPDALLGRIVAEVHAHQGGDIGSDDQTLIVLRLSGPLS